MERITAKSKPLYGGGLLRLSNEGMEESSVNREWIKRQAPGANAFDLISLLPGAHASGSDNLGLSPQDALSIRGLGSGEIGYLLEGMPMNDMATQGGVPSQFADSENLESITLKQGATDIQDDLLNGAGGTVSLKFRNPENHFHVQNQFSAGSYNELRDYIRLDTGYLGHSGIKGFASFSTTNADNWRGAGSNYRRHIDFKFLKEWGAENSMAVLGSWNRAVTTYYPQVGKDGDHAAGANLDKHWNAANLSDPQKQYYDKLYRDPEQTLYLGAPLHLRIDPHLTFDGQIYGQLAYGNWPSSSAQLAPDKTYYGNDPVGSLSPQGTGNMLRADWNQRTPRGGLNLALTHDYRFNRLSVGWWGDLASDAEKSPYAPVNQDGHSPDIWGFNPHDHIRDGQGREFYASAFRTNSIVNAIFIDDRIHWKTGSFDLGFKEVLIHERGKNLLPGIQPKFHQNYAVPLPRLGFTQRLGHRDNIFIHVGTNFRRPDYSALYTSYYGYGANPADGPPSQQAATNLKKEYSVQEEIGWRHQGKWFGATLTFFNYNFQNRQVNTTLPVPQKSSMIATTVNAGGQTSRGVDIEAGTRKWRGLSAYASFEYVHAALDKDMTYAGARLPTKGRIAVNTPPVLVGFGLDYEAKNGFFGMFSLHYTARQYGTFTNDQKIPGYVTENLGVGYRAKNIKLIQAPTIRLNVVNLSHQRYLSSAGTITPSLAPQDAPKYYLSGGTSIIGTIQAGF